MIYQGYDLVPFRNGELFYVAIYLRAAPVETTTGCADRETAMLQAKLTVDRLKERSPASMGGTG
jgi:hypothetical protein